MRFSRRLALNDKSHQASDNAQESNGEKRSEPGIKKSAGSRPEKQPKAHSKQRQNKPAMFR
jgi:hypothetical protein